MTAVAGDRLAFRTLMAQWPTGATIVSTSDGTGPAGCTVSALMSLSDSPPLVVVSLLARSATLAAIRRAGRFAITVLSSAQAGLCADFARLPLTERFSATELREVDGLPLPTGGVAALTCELDDELPYADHVLLVGAPTWTEIREDRDPLLVHRRELKAVS
ncbi:flavin reductase family protein [Amycolatopsis sp. NPDC004772]|uniref:flavin reductase family protein n=1 Tax=unclassified Amycolatopsis TaxID=2618356 RepID=UPI002874B0C3|nr:MULTISPECIES: flavin reductase family protein [unclassified Amycolatopsis]MDS0140044.1 flavin reductase family protein [Amycolatopsis sp. 505]MDS0146937.1 flavin reductase family protein [Amycolatopsis sp. CM201R]